MFFGKYEVNEYLININFTMNCTIYINRK